MDDSAGTLSNEPIDVGSLPRLHDDAFVSVDPRHALGSIVVLVVVAVVAVVGGVVITARTDEMLWTWIAIGIAVLTLASAGWSWAGAKRVGYQVRDHDLSLRSGIVSLVVQTVPFRRVQHVQLSRGLLDRSLGLASLSINSAGPDIGVPGLPVETATTLRAWIVERAGLDSEEAGDEVDPAVEPTGPPPGAPLPPPPSPAP